jgi:hypothetical protein
MVGGLRVILLVLVNSLILVLVRFHLVVGRMLMRLLRLPMRHSRPGVGPLFLIGFSTCLGLSEFLRSIRRILLGLISRINGKSISDSRVI